MDQSNGHHSGWRSWDTDLEMMEYEAPSRIGKERKTMLTCLGRFSGSPMKIFSRNISTSTEHASSGMNGQSPSNGRPSTYRGLQTITVRNL